MKNRILIIGAALILVLAAVIIYVLTRPADKVGEFRKKSDGSFEDPTEQLKEFAEGGYRITYEQVLSDYRKWSRYPPNSRPLKAEFGDVIRHQQIELPFQPMPVVKPDGTLGDAAYACRLQPVEHTVVEGESMVIQVACRTSENQTPAELKIESVSLIRFLDDKTWGVRAPDIRPGNAQNEWVTELEFKPQPQDWGEMDLAVKFSIHAEKPGFVHEKKVTFFSSPVAPAKFTGKFAEKLENGSLVLSVELDVRMPGRYTVEGNLFTTDDRPVAHVRADARLTGGKQMVDLLFFGKIFHDQGAGGSYVLKGVRGIQDTGPLDPELLNRPVKEVEKIIETTRTTEPDRRVIPWFKESFKTKAYKLEDFSPAEFDSDQKRERIKELEKLAAQD